ncbi:MAG: acyltransferase family protein, partial [Clostridia bacterium]|nr:acyltransferase family protein [Clostridia bacterium]
MVVFIHQEEQFIEHTTNTLDVVFNFSYSFLSHTITAISVPLFFLFSGYLYFYKIEKFDKGVYFSKTRKRVKSLILPYFYWNLIAVLFYLVLNILSVVIKGNSVQMLDDYFSSLNWHTFWDSSSTSGGTCCFGMYKTSGLTGPLVMALWYVRNLIILVLISPVIYYLVKKTGTYLIFLLGGCYFSGIWLNCTYFNITGVFFFTWGAYMSLNKMTIIDCLSKWKVFFYIGAIIWALLYAYLDVTGKNGFWLAISKPAYVICGVISVYNIMYSLIKSGRHTNQLPFLAKSSFFIFCIHLIGINHYVALVVQKVVNFAFSFSPSFAHI